MDYIFVISYIKNITLVKCTKCDIYYHLIPDIFVKKKIYNKTLSYDYGFIFNEINVEHETISPKCNGTRKIYD